MEYEPIFPKCMNTVLLYIYQNLPCITFPSISVLHFFSLSLVISEFISATGTRFAFRVRVFIFLKLNTIRETPTVRAFYYFLKKGKKLYKERFK